MSNINHLVLSWSTSRGKDTYGYNICRLDDRNNAQRYKCIGGGYDMVGTVVANWLCDKYQDRLEALRDRAHYLNMVAGREANQREDSIYGLPYHENGNHIHIDGACGIECVLKIAKMIGLDMDRDYISKGRRRGETVGWYVTEEATK